MQKSKTLKHQQQKPEGNGKSELQEIREDNIEAAKKQKSKTISKHTKEENSELIVSAHG